MSASRGEPAVVAPCPRCRRRSLRVWLHFCHRMACHGTADPACPKYDTECTRCEYPMPKGSRSWPSGKPYWAYGRYVSRRAQEIFGQPIEPLPAPLNERIVCGSAPGQCPAAPGTWANPARGNP